MSGSLSRWRTGGALLKTAGLQEKERERIFREFFRVDDSLTARVQGTGLGLTIARRIARDHGGELAHRPREGGGSDFVLSLPEAPR